MLKSEKIIIQLLKLLLYNKYINELGNEFWESQGFTKREDLSYRNKALVDLKRIDT